MEDIRNTKIERILGIYTKLMNGALISKSEEAVTYGVNERSIQRDIDDIRNFLETSSDKNGFTNTVIYDRVGKGYRLEQIYKSKLTNSEILAICKILLDSRAFIKEEMSLMLNKLMECCVPANNQKLVGELVGNEVFHYVEPRHKTSFLETMWMIGQAIRKSQYLEIDYYRIKDKTIVTRKVMPVAIMFSEFYFYMTAFIADGGVRKGFEVINDSFPTIYRIDRIKNIKVQVERFHIPYSSRFEEGEFRKKIQFMYGGKLQRVKFRYLGPDIDAVLDRLPTAQVIEEGNGTFLVSAEVFGKGIDMWLRSQGNYIEIPKEQERSYESGNAAALRIEVKKDRM